jgi:hypothetical protein
MNTREVFPKRITQGFERGEKGLMGCSTRTSSSSMEKTEGAFSSDRPPLGLSRKGVNRDGKPFPQTGLFSKPVWLFLHRRPDATMG